MYVMLFMDVRRIVEMEERKREGREKGKEKGKKKKQREKDK